MNDKQRAAWDAEFGKPTSPCLFYTQERPLTAQEFIYWRSYQRTIEKKWASLKDERVIKAIIESNNQPPEH